MIEILSQIAAASLVLHRFWLIPICI